MVSRRIAVLALAGALGTGCQTVVLTASNLDTPVLVGPVRPEPRQGEEFRKTRVRQRAVHRFDSTRPADPTHRAYQKDEAAIFDLALGRSIGDCVRCWVLADSITFSTFYHLFSSTSLLVTMEENRW